MNTPLNILRCEPYNIDNSDCDETHFLGMKYPFPVTVWRIFIDEECIAQKALPFTSGDRVIELSANPCLPYLSEGSNYVLVRQSGHQIFWFRAARYDWENAWMEDFSQLDMLHCFDTTQYLKSIRIGRQTQDESTLPPPLLNTEIRLALKKVFPRDLDLPLYRIPERDGDTRGEKLFRQVWNMISSGTLYIADVPERVVEVRIGLDTHEFRECIWQVGKVGDDVAIYFQAEPYFPVWIGGFKEAFRAEAALFESIHKTQ